MVLGYYAKVDFGAFETFSAREQNWNHYFPNLIYPLITIILNWTTIVF